MATPVDNNCNLLKLVDMEDIPSLAEELPKNNPLTGIQATLHLNSFEYAKYLDLKAHRIYSYRDITGNFVPYYDLAKSYSFMSLEKWHKKIQMYKTAEKLKDKYILMKDGINGLPIPRPVRIEFSLDGNASWIMNEVQNFTYKEKKEK